MGYIRDSNGNCFHSHVTFYVIGHRVIQRALYFQKFLENLTRVLTVLLEPGYGTILESRCGLTLFVIKRRVWVTTDTRDGQAERLLNTTIYNDHKL